MLEITSCLKTVMTQLFFYNLKTGQDVIGDILGKFNFGYDDLGNNIGNVLVLPKGFLLEFNPIETNKKELYHKVFLDKNLDVVWQREDDKSYGWTRDIDNSYSAISPGFHNCVAYGGVFCGVYAVQGFVWCF